MRRWIFLCENQKCIRMRDAAKREGGKVRNNGKHDLAETVANERKNTNSDAAKADKGQK